MAHEYRIDGDFSFGTEVPCLETINIHMTVTSNSTLYFSGEGFFDQKNSL